MKQNRVPRNKSAHSWTIDLWQGRQEYTMRKRHMMLGKLDSYTLKKKRRIRTFSYSKYKQGERSKSKNKQMGHNLNLKAFAQQRKPSTKCKDNLVNGRKYLQMIWPMKSLYPKYKHMQIFLLLLCHYPLYNTVIIVKLKHEIQYMRVSGSG